MTKEDTGGGEITSSNAVVKAIPATKYMPESNPAIGE